MLACDAFFQVMTRHLDTLSNDRCRSRIMSLSFAMPAPRRVPAFLGCVLNDVLLAWSGYGVCLCGWCCCCTMMKVLALLGNGPSYSRRICFHEPLRCWCMRKWDREDLTLKCNKRPLRFESCWSQMVCCPVPALKLNKALYPQHHIGRDLLQALKARLGCWVWVG